MSRSVSSREVRLHDQESLTELCRVNPGCTYIVSHEMSRGDGEKEARRNIYGIRSGVYIIGERERANLVLQLDRGVCIYIYIYVICCHRPTGYRISF